MKNINAERSVLGSMLLEPSKVPVVEAVVQDASAFYLPRHELIFRAIVDSYHDTGATDPIAVGQLLARRDRLQDAGGNDLLLELMEAVMHGGNARMHAEIVAECARNRRVSEWVQGLISPAKRGQLDVAAAAQKLQKLAEASSQRPAPVPLVRDWREVAKDPPVAFLMAGLIAKGADHVLGGTPGAGKSCIAAGIALAAAHGQGFLGAELRQPFSTLILCGEGMAGNGARMRAWQAANPSAMPAPGQYFAYVDGVPNLLEPGPARDFIDARIAECVEKYGHAPDLVVLDTLARATPGIEENDNGAMGCAISVLGDVRRRHGCATLAVHHLRKPSAFSPRRPKPTDMLAELRGAGAIGAAVDVALFAVRDGDARYLSVGKTRDGKDGEVIDYEIRGTLTGHLGDGGGPEWGPVVTPASPVDVMSDEVKKAAEQAEQTKQLESDIAAVVATVEKEGRVQGIDTMAQLACLPRRRGRAAVSCALSRKLIMVTGKTVDRWYVEWAAPAVTESAAGGASDDDSTAAVDGADNSRNSRQPPIPPVARRRELRAPRNEEELPPESVIRRESARVGASADEGLPEKLRKRRRGKKGVTVRGPSNPDSPAPT